MKKRLLLLFTLFVAVTTVLAAPISESEAREKAAQFIFSKKGSASEARSAHRFGGSGRTGATLTAAEAREAFYVFNIDSVGGYVIVSGDDRMPDVLGYSYSGTYKSDEIPANMRAWLEGYAEQYEYLQTHSDAKGASLTTVSGSSIAPMLSCHWGQGFPYNERCPMINGERTVTGCVATAMAQIMYYHQWPKQTTKEIPAYTTSTHELSMPEIGITTIDWDNIMSTYSYYSSEMRKGALSTLMLLCGSAVKMDYDIEGSGAYDSNAKNAFVDYFGYSSSISYVHSSTYSNKVWNQLIYDELKDGRPVYYSGRAIIGPDETAGHAFVIDGYGSNNYFHVNWGWGGDDDSYFLLTALNTTNGDYNLNQSAIIGIDGGQNLSKLPYAVLDDGLLTFYYDNKQGSRSGILLNWNSNNWKSEEYKKQVTSIVFDPSCAEYKYLSSTSFMFEGFSNLVSIQGVEYLNTENVTDMYSMFDGCKSLTSLDVSNFDTKNVTDMRYMFYDCSNLTSLDVSSFDTKNVTSMKAMFYNCSALTSLNVSNFNTENVENMGWMFYNCKSITSLDVSGFNTDKVTLMKSMFYSCNTLTSLDISNFNTQNVTDMSWMFAGCNSLEVIYIGNNWSVANVTNGDSMFYNCYELIGEKGTQYSSSKRGHTYAHIDGGIDDPGYFSIKGTYIPYAILSEDNKVLTFCYGNRESSREGMRVKIFDSSSSRGWDSASQYIEKVVFDESFADYLYVYSTKYWFYNCENLKYIQGLEKLNTNNVTDMFCMFGDCSSLTSLDVSNFNTKKVTDMRYMFYNCGSLTSLDVSNFDTKNVTNMKSMFYDCSAMTSLDVSTFDTENVTDISFMFYDCSALTSLDVSNFDTQNVTSMKALFYDCSTLTSLDISNFDTENVTDMSYMFRGCTLLRTIYVGEDWNTPMVTDSNYMFYDCINLVGQAGTKYNYNYRDKEYARIDKGTSAPGYFSSKTNSLRGDVNDDGLVNGTDIQAVINFIVEGRCDEKADVNNDNIVNGTDIQEIINIIVNKE